MEPLSRRHAHSQALHASPYTYCFAGPDGKLRTSPVLPAGTPWISRAQFEDQIDENGWTFLRLEGRVSANDTETAFAAGKPRLASRCGFACPCLQRTCVINALGWGLCFCCMRLSTTGFLEGALTWQRIAQFAFNTAVNATLGQPVSRASACGDACTLESRRPASRPACCRCRLRLERSWRPGLLATTTSWPLASRPTPQPAHSGTRWA